MIPMLNNHHLYNPFQPTLTKPGLALSGLEQDVLYPAGILAGKVHSFLQIRAKRATRYMIMPDGTQALFISPAKCMLGGTHVKAYEMSLLGLGVYFGIRFYPGALRHFFSTDASDITGSFADEQYLPGTGLSSLSDRIYSQGEFFARAKVCEQWLLDHYKPAPLSILDRALQCIYKAKGNIRVDALSKAVGCCSRHLNRYFSFNTGVSVKSFIQIVRIQSVYKQRYINPQNTLQAALAAGYYDQAHFLNTAKKMLPEPQRVFFEQIKSDFYNT